MTEPPNHQTHRLPRIILFSGPPLSGKSTLAARFEDEVGGVLLGMDAFRLARLPDSDQGKRDRNVAYRMVLEEADRLLTQQTGATVILDATYAPAEHRGGVIHLAEKHEAELYVVECRVSPNDAAERFRRRPEGHAAVDLNQARVRDIAATWSYYGGGLLVDTSEGSQTLSREESVTRSLHYIRRYVEARKPIASFEDWVESAPGPATSSLVQRDEPESISPRRISPRSKPQARVVVYGAIALTLIMTAFFVWASIELYEEWKKGEPVAEELFAAASTLGAAVGFFEYFRREGFLNAWGMIRAGSTARFGPILELHRSNREIWAEYAERITRREVLDAMPMPGVPICFVVPPGPEVSFDVRCRMGDDGWDQQRLAHEAATSSHVPFNWYEFAEWRTSELHRSYFGWLRGHTDYLRVGRVTGLPKGETSDRTLIVHGSMISYADYLVTEQSARIEIPSQLPYLREFFEGPAWDRRDLDLRGLDFSDARYSMMAGVSTIITTEDCFVVLQRRSGHVQAAGGGVGCSSGGGVNWSDVKSVQDRRVIATDPAPSLRRTMFRETREELGLKSGVFVPDPQPFIGAALNLRYGRDLNFYAHLHCTLKWEELARGFRLGMPQRVRHLRSRFHHAKDKWEISHLLPLHVDQLSLDEQGRFPQEVEDLLGAGRHVRGALYALVTSGRLSSVS